MPNIALSVEEARSLIVAIRREEETLTSLLSNMKNFPWQAQTVLKKTVAEELDRLTILSDKLEAFVTNNV